MAQILDNDLLFKQLSTDFRAAERVYKPGNYWIRKTRNAVRAIRKEGISDFRANSSVIGLSYADNQHTDTRIFYKHGSILGRQFFRLLKASIPIGRAFDLQESYTSRMRSNYTNLRDKVVNLSPYVKTLVRELRLPSETLSGGCENFVRLGDTDVAYHYLILLDRIHRYGKECFINGYSYMEIGGGFGANVHLIHENYPNIRKFLYVDIHPNIYVGTQYLRSVYGDAVKDYSFLKDVKSIDFEESRDLEILCIPNWLLPRLSSGLRFDIFHNASSFTEMPRHVIEHYARLIELHLSETSRILLQSYLCFDASSSLDPDHLPSFFPKFKFDKLIYANQILGDEGQRGVLFDGRKYGEMHSS